MSTTVLGEDVTQDFELVWSIQTDPAALPHLTRYPQLTT